MKNLPCGQTKAAREVFTMQGKVEICGVNTARLRVLDSETTRALLKKVRAGDKAAREELIAGNLRLVLSVIQRFASRGENTDDLFQVGVIGLIKAIDNFDSEAHDVRFSTYGVPMMIEWRKTEREVFPMTRKEALSLAIKALAAAGANEEAITILHTLSEELPHTKWSEAAIRDAVEQYILDHGKVPSPYAFQKKGLPPHTVIQNRYGMTVKDWLAENYPTVKQTPEEHRAEATEAFKAEYLCIKPRSSEEFDAKRSPGIFSWYTIAVYNHTHQWRRLLELLGLPAYSRVAAPHSPEQFKVNIFTHYDFRD